MPVTSPQRYWKARCELFDGLVSILDRMNEDELAGKSNEDTVLLVGQRLSALVVRTEHVLRGLTEEE